MREVGKLAGQGPWVRQGFLGQQVRGEREEQTGRGAEKEGGHASPTTCVPSPDLSHLGADQGPAWDEHAKA